MPILGLYSRLFGFSGEPCGCEKALSSVGSRIQLQSQKRLSWEGEPATMLQPDTPDCAVFAARENLGHATVPYRGHPVLPINIRNLEPIGETNFAKSVRGLGGANTLGAP